MNSATVTSKTRLWVWLRLLAATVAVLGLGWVFLSATGFFFLQSRGREISPYSFSGRDFQIYRWFGGTVVQPSSLACSTEISKHLTIPTRTYGIERWDLVTYWGGFFKGEVKSEASILVEAFETRDSKAELVWEKWSKENPGLARILWPAVQQLAIHRAYFALPELLKDAAACPQAGELSKAIDGTSLRAGLDQAARHIAKNEFSDARIALEWAKTLGSSPEIEPLELSIQAGLKALSDNTK